MLDQDWSSLETAAESRVVAAGMNLLDADHGEYGPIETRSRIPRTVFLQLLWLGPAR